MSKALLLFLIALAFCADLDLEKVREDILARHNYLRAQHQVGKLTRLSDLESLAQTWAEKVAADKKLDHSSDKYNGNHIGQNLFSGPLNSTLGTYLVDYWYSEYPKYDFNNPDWTPEAGHFTQIVWKATTYLGCGAKYNADEYRVYVCCNYFPAGNYLNQFAKNVFPKKSSSSDDTPTPDTAAPDTTAPDTAAPDTAAPDTTVPDTVDDDALEKYRESAKNRHNELRAEHQVGNLVRDAELERLALLNAKDMLEKDTYIFNAEKYTDGGYIGENIFWSKGGEVDGKAVTNMWYGGVSKYDFNNPGFSNESGGFTQLVWKATQKIGCAYACKGKDEEKECYGNCLYYPGGNVNERFKDNVFQKK